MFKFIKKAQKVFKELKKTFIKTSILLHFDFKRRIRLKIDAFDFAISEILFQLIEETNQWHSIVFFSRKMFAAKRNYEIEEDEMLAMIESCRVFRHYVKKRCYRFKCWSITLIWTYSSRIKSWIKKKHDDEKNSMIWIFTLNINRIN
jgi:hypothetical protein